MNGAKGIIQGIGGLVYMLIPISASLALLFFFWGLAKFILHSGDEKGREEGKEVMKWGIIALFVLVSIWGIVFFIRGELGISEILSI